MIHKNPLTMTGRLNRCWLFTYRMPLADAEALLPPSLEPVSFGGCAFWNVVVCQIRSLRPQNLPALVGIGYRHAAYRIYARFHPPSGPPKEGLYFVRSECDSALLAGAGNILTDYAFHRAEIYYEDLADGACLRIESPDAPGNATVRRQEPDLTAGSPFRSLDEANRFLRYSPRGISVAPTGEVNIVEIRRNEDAWRCHPRDVETAYWKFLESRRVEPELCYEVDPIDYEWRRGVVYGSRPTVQPATEAAPLLVGNFV